MSSKHAVLFLSFFLFRSILYAQDSSFNQLDEVVVTANKFAQKQSTTGKVITVINKDLIEKSAGKTLTQLLNEQAAIVINGALNNLGSVQSVYTRGAASGRTLILLDGIPVNDPSMINNEFDLNLFSLNNIERIEICKGAQSTLYGSDAVAGVINIITTKANINKPFNGTASVAAGNYNTWKGNAQVYGKVGKLSYSAAYAKLYTDGFSSAKDTGKNHFDKDGYNNDALRGSLQYQATNNLSFKTFIQYSRYKTGVDGSSFYDDKDYIIHNNNLLTGAGFTYKNDVVSVTGNYQYNEAHRHNLNDSTDGSFYYKDDYFGKTQFAELYASVKLGKGFTLLQGGDYRINNMSNVNTYGSFKDTSVSQASLYGSLYYNGLHEKLTIELGGRLNVHSRYGSNYTYTFNPAYSVTKNWQVYGSIASGFKVPSLYQLYSAYGDPNLSPEKSVNYEGGIHYGTSKVNVRATYFNRRITNGLDYNYTTNIYFNYDKERAQGVELEGKVQIAKPLSITANYTFLNAREQTKNREPYKFDPNTYTYYFNDTTYHYALRRPKHSVNVTFAYNYKDFEVSISGKYISKRFDAMYASEDIKLDDYFIFNAYAEYNLKKNLKVFTNAQNLFNKTFYDVYGYNSIPFLINGGVTFSF